VRGVTVTAVTPNTVTITAVTPNIVTITTVTAPIATVTEPPLCENSGQCSR